MAYLDPVVVRVKADLGDTLDKIRAVKAELDTLRSKTVNLKVKESFDQATKAIADTRKALQGASSDTNSFGQSLRRVFADIKSGADGHNGIFGKLFGGGGGLLKGVWNDLKGVGSAIGNVFSALTTEGESAGEAMGKLGSSLASLGASGPVAVGALVVVAGAVTAVGAAVQGLLSATGALLAGGLGIGAFAAVAYPQFKKISGAMSQINSDTQAYHRALTATAKSDALKHLKQDWASLSPAQREAVHGINNLRAGYDRIVKALAPDVFKVFNAGLRVANHLMPLLKPLASAAAGAILQLLNHVDKFTQSKGFQQWFQQVIKIIPGAISAVGNFIGKLIALVGHVITNKNSLNDLKNTLNIVMGVVKFVTGAVHFLASAFQLWLKFMSPVIGTVRLMIGAVNKLISPLDHGAGVVRDLAASFSLLASMISRAANVASSVGSFLGGIGSKLGFESGTSGAPPGWAWTGEKGPELVKMTGGEIVIPHGPSMAMARNAPGYANGVGSLGAAQPVNVYIDGKKLFSIMQGRTLKYNVNNNARAGGRVTGAMAPNR